MSDQHISDQANSDHYIRSSYLITPTNEKVDVLDESVIFYVHIFDAFQALFEHVGLLLRVWASFLRLFKVPRNFRFYHFFKKWTSSPLYRTYLQWGVGLNRNYLENFILFSYFQSDLRKVGEEGVYQNTYLIHITFLSLLLTSTSCWWATFSKDWQGGRWTREILFLIYLQSSAVRCWAFLVKKKVMCR